MARPAQSLIGKPRTRFEGRDKVTGTARYPSDMAMPNPAYAMLVTSAIAKGRVRRFDLAEAERVPGFLAALTHENTKGQFKTPPTPGDSSGKSPTTLESDKIWHDGQIIAVVVADSYEAAREAAYKVRVEYDAEPASATFDSEGLVEKAASEVDDHEDPTVGDAPSAFAAAPVQIDAQYETPTQHHNPMELYDTTCVWSGNKLTIHEPSQFVHGLRGGVARQLGIPLADVRVESQLVGGAFGSRGGVTARTALVALAAKRVNRPVRLVPTRAQGFTILTYRAETRQQVKLGARRDGKLDAVIHEGWEITSRPTNYYVAGTEATARLYGSPNVATKVNIVHADRNTPGFMRAPPHTPYVFALESAMDELAIALNMDPIELRRINDTKKEPIKGVPFTSRSLMQCFDEAAAAFGWSKRSRQAGSMRDGDWLAGYGCASAIYPAEIGGAAVRLVLDPQGSARVQMAAHDIGTGTETIIAGLINDRLNIPLEKITIEIGDSDLPPAGISAGSIHAASVCNAVAKACDEAQARLKQSNDAFEKGAIEIYAENLPNGAAPDAIKKLYAGQPSFAESENNKFAFGAQFAEVRVHARTREIRVPRIVGAFAAGTIMNALTAKSQLMGGMIWGVSAALHEKTDIDRREARYTNTNLADYLIAVNADIPSAEVILVPEEDKLVNPLGIKGVGELGIVGMNAAIANAVYHATGTRVRKLPVRIEQLL